MADVYLAVQESLKRNVALKILKQHLASNEEYIDRFKREAQAAAALVHANIVQIFEVGQADGYHFIAQEYIRGRNLKQYLGRYGAVPPDMALSVMRQSVMALQKGAEHKVVHRDIKPENIMLTANGEIKITDFGLARVGNESENTLTQAGITVGTPLYMSPEQIEGSEVDIRSDIYSLGVTLYHMLAGEPPFDGDSPIAIAVKHASQAPDPISEHRTDLPPEFADIIRSMLHKKKEDRPQNPMQIMRMLQPINIEASNGFDWRLFEPLPQSPDLGTTNLLESATETMAVPQRSNRSVLFSGLFVWPAIALLSLGCWWAGSQIATQFSGMKNNQAEPTYSEIEGTVPMENSVGEQYLAAYWNSRDIGDDDYIQREQLWKAVARYFPVEESAPDTNTTKLYHLRALCRLGEIYIESGKMDQATEVYDELASQEEMSLEFRATGLAGRAIALSLRDASSFGGELQEQESSIRYCLDAETGGVRENVDLLSDFLRQRVQVLLDRFKSYGGKYLPAPRPTDFADRIRTLLSQVNRS
jgi:serine/threonine-protein kinase